MKTTMGKIVALNGAIMFVSGIQQNSKFKFKASTSMYLRAVAEILTPWCKAFQDENKARQLEITGGKEVVEQPTMEMQLAMQAVVVDLMQVDVDVRLPKKKHSSDELNLDENAIPVDVLQALAMIFDFPAEELEDGEDVADPKTFLELSRPEARAKKTADAAAKKMN